MKWILVFASGLLMTSEAGRIKRQFFPDEFQGANVGDQFGNQFFSSRYPQFNQGFENNLGFNRPNQGFNNQGFNNNNQGFNNNQQRPNQGFNNNNQGFNNNQQQPNQGFNNNQGINNNNQQRPNQGFNNNNNQGFTNNQQQQTTQGPIQTTQATTLAPAVQTCVDGCPGRTTAEYNPVCGSDNQTYSNPSRLDCARECGANVPTSRRGACRTVK